MRTNSTFYPLVLIGLATFLGLLSVASTARASILVGTFVESTPESITKMNQLIDDYNNDFSASLPQVDSLVDKIDDVGNVADFIGSNLELSHFDFYDRDDNGSTELNIFSKTPEKFSSSSADWGFTAVDLNVRAFDQVGGPAFAYYVSKDGNKGWSLWFAMAGLNPAYTDAGIGDSSIVGSDFTRGAISVSTLAYDPIKNGISHISFYSSAPVIIPEPSTVITWSLFGALGLGFGHWRRRQRAAY